MKNISFIHFSITFIILHTSNLKNTIINFFPKILPRKCSPNNLLILASVGDEAWPSVGVQCTPAPQFTKQTRHQNDYWIFYKKTHWGRRVTLNYLGFTMRKDLLSSAISLNEFYSIRFCCSNILTYFTCDWDLFLHFWNLYKKMKR